MARKCIKIIIKQYLLLSHGRCYICISVPYTNCNAYYGTEKFENSLLLQLLPIKYSINSISRGSWGSSRQNVLCFGTLSLDTTPLLIEGRPHHLVCLVYCLSITNYSSGDHFFSQLSFVSFGPDPVARLYCYCLTIGEVCTYSSLRDSNACQASPH